MALVQTAQVAEWLGWSPDKVTERQADLTRITEAASTSIRRMCGRAFEPVTEARTFSPTMLRWEVLVGDVSAVTAVEVRSAPQNAYTALEQADYETLRSSNREDWPDDTLVRTDGAWFYPGPNALRVTATWGFETIPEAIEQATLMLSANLLARAQSPKQVGSSFTGTEIDLGGFYDMDIMELTNDFKIGAVSVG